MPKIKPFRGIHYDPMRTYGLSPVIGPPEDLPDSDHIRQVVAGHPYHSLRLEAGNPEDPDPEHLREIVFERWLDDGILVRDRKPAYYVHEHRYRYQGVYQRRLGLIVAADLRDDERSGFRPHEGTIRENLEFRADLLRRLRLSISPILSLIRDGGWLGALLADLVHQRPPDLSGHDVDEGIHRVWVLDDPSLTGWINELVAQRPLYIADGHHRFAAARACRQRSLDHGFDPGPANFALTLIVSEFDPGMTILPIHREIRTLDLPWEEMRARLESLFQVECALPEDQVDPEIVARRAQRLSESDYHLPEFLLLSRSDPQLCRVRLKDWTAAEQIVDSNAVDAVKNLDITVLHRVLLEHLLEIDPDAPESVLSYTADAEEMARRVLGGESEIGLFVRTTRIEQVLAVADAGAHMPQKSTYFYPKVPAGLMMYDLG